MFRGDKRRDLALSKAFVRRNSTLLASASSKVKFRHTITRGILSANTPSCRAFYKVIYHIRWCEFMLWREVCGFGL